MTWFEKRFFWPRNEKCCISRGIIACVDLCSKGPTFYSVFKRIRGLHWMDECMPWLTCFGKRYGFENAFKQSHVFQCFLRCNRLIIIDWSALTDRHWLFITDWSSLPDHPRLIITDWSSLTDHHWSFHSLIAGGRSGFALTTHCQDEAGTLPEGVGEGSGTVTTSWLR